MTARPLNILLVCRSFPAHRAGGMEWHAQDIADGLAARGHTVHIATTRLPATPALRPLRTNGEIIEIGGRGDGRYSLEFLRRLPAEVRALCRRTRIDVIHAQGFAGIPLAPGRRALPPVITTIHGTLFSETPLDRRAWPTLSPRQRLAALWRFKHRLAAWPLWRAFLRSGMPFIADSAFTARELRREGVRAPVAVVPLGIDLDRHPRGARLAFDAATGRLVAPSLISGEPPLLLLALGRLERIKGFATLLDACAHLPRTRPWRLVLAGDGPDRARLEARAAALDIADRVFFAGRLAPEALADWMASADVFLNPDQGQPAFGLVLAEALVQGAPVLASRVGAHGEVLRPGDGRLLPAGESHAWTAALAAALDRLPEPPARRTRRAHRARTRFTRDAMIDGLEALYRGFL
ncbi:MAG: hypothetical protein PWP23_2588 [Candidatus Sumerlaeota bacterium]|nr:hypothetical protein [Candidatus Sumerlaeota bacterium]